MQKQLISKLEWSLPSKTYLPFFRQISFRTILRFCLR